MYQNWWQELTFRRSVAASEKFRLLVGQAFDMGQVCEEDERMEQYADTIFIQCPKFTIGSHVTVQAEGIYGDKIVLPPCEAWVNIKYQEESEWIYLQTNSHKNTHTNALTQTHSPHTNTLTQTHSQTHSHKHTHIFGFIYKHLHTNTLTQTHPQKHIHTNTPTQTHRQTHTHKHTHPNTQKQSQTHTNTNTHKHKHKHKHTQTHKHTHTNTHSYLDLFTN